MYKYVCEHLVVIQMDIIKLVHIKIAPWEKLF